MFRGAAGIAEDRKGWLFRTARGHKGSILSEKPMGQPDAWRMIRRRAAAAGIAEAIGCHTFRATGITSYLHRVAWIGGAGALSPTRVPGYTIRTYSGRPSFSIRFSTSAAMATSLACRPSVC